MKFTYLKWIKIHLYLKCGKKKIIGNIWQTKKGPKRNIVDKKKSVLRSGFAKREPLVNFNNFFFILQLTSTYVIKIEGE